MKRRAWLWGPILALAAIVGPVLEDPGRPPGLCLTALAVGQGDSLLLEFPDGSAWLVDGGGTMGGYDVGERKVLPALRRRGIDRLAAVVMTHDDLDHAGGLLAVLRQMEVDTLLVPSRRTQRRLGRELVAEAARRGIDVVAADEGGKPPSPPGTSIAVLHPRRPSDLGANDGSVVLRVARGGVSMLLTGDVEAAGEQALLDAGSVLEAAVLKVAHHGSRTSSSRELLRAVAPLVAIAGIGDENRFGFPHHSVVQRLRRAEAPLYWTGRHGEVRACTDGLELVVDVGGPDWRRVRSYGAAQLAARAEVLQGVGSGARRPEASGSRCPPSGAGHRAGAKRAKKRTGTGGRKAARRGRAPEPATPAPPLLIEEREWARSRRERRKPKPPWASRR